jgi:hypothetical protein
MSRSTSSKAPPGFETCTARIFDMVASNDDLAMERALWPIAAW